MHSKSLFAAVASLFSILALYILAFSSVILVSIIHLYKFVYRCLLQALSVLEYF